MRRLWLLLAVLALLTALIAWRAGTAPARDYLFCDGQGFTDDGRPCPEG